MKGRLFLTALALVAGDAGALSAQQTVATPATAAQSTTPQITAPQGGQRVFVLGLGAGSMSIGSAAATASQVGERSYGLQIDAGLLMARHFYFGADIGGQFLNDKAQFTQNTTAGEMKSSASVTYFSAVVGMRAPLGATPLAVGVNGGYSLATTRRSIDNCVDCQVDKLHIPGGAFVEPLLLLGRGSARLRMSDRMYVAGDGMRSVISLGAELQPRRK